MRILSVMLQVSYLWSTTETTPAIAVHLPGNYWAMATLATCSITDSIRIDTLNFQPVALGNDTTLCEGDALQLDATMPEADSYLWNTGATTAQLSVSDAGIYRVDVGHACGTTSDSIATTVEPCACTPRVPNVFTPNGDGYNDELEITCVETGSWRFTVYGRYGHELFRTTRPHGHRWTGRTFTGVMMEDGVYFTLLVNLDTGEEYRNYVHLLR